MKPTGAAVYGTAIARCCWMDQAALPPTPLPARQPGWQKPGCGFPVPKILGVIDAFTGVMLEMLIFPLYTHEQPRPGGQSLPPQPP